MSFLDPLNTGSRNEDRRTERRTLRSDLAIPSLVFDLFFELTSATRPERARTR